MSFFPAHGVVALSFPVAGVAWLDASNAFPVVCVASPVVCVFFKALWRSYFGHVARRLCAPTLLFRTVDRVTENSVSAI